MYCIYDAGSGFIQDDMTKGIKIYLIVVTVLLVIALGFGVYVWLAIQSLGQTQVTQSGSGGANTTLLTEQEEVSEPVPVSGKIVEPIVVSGDQLTDSQKNALETFGLESDSFTITEEMIVCAEDALGVERVQQIVGGATPNPLESLQLLGCIKKAN